MILLINLFAYFIQRDIERMFSQQIQIFDPVAISTGTIDAIIGTFLKFGVKTIVEHSRQTCLDTVIYRSRLADFSLLKQVKACTLLYFTYLK